MAYWAKYHVAIQGRTLNDLLRFEQTKFSLS